MNPKDPYGDVPEAQSLLAQGVQGDGDALQPSILKDVGDALGGLNSTGSLRSGGATVALGDISSKYGAMIGAYAKQASEAGVSAGLAARRQRFAEDQAAQQRKSGILKAIGSVLGAGIGFLAAGPGGAAVGAKAASGVGDRRSAFGDGPEGGDSFGDGFVAPAGAGF